MTKEELYELKHKRAGKVAEGNGLLAKKDFEGHAAKMEEVDALNAEIDAAEKQLAEEGRFEDTDGHMKGLAAAGQQKREAEAREKSVDGVRGTNEYAQAFAKALKSHAKVRDSRGVEDFKPLYKALAESGGTPEGADGGFLVPVDFDYTIQKMEKEYFDLSTFFNAESVNTLTGWRVIEDGVPKPLPKVAELGKIGKDDQPSFRRISYAVEKYADRLTISDELLSDNAANLLAYVAGWYGPKYILTKNQLLLPFLTGLTSEVALAAGQEVKLLKKALITKLNTAYSKAASMITNQSGFAEMDGWEDKNGRPMLVPNPADPLVTRFQARSVAYGDDDLLPVEAGKIPLYVGNFKALATLFVRKGFEMATTDVGGDAWETDSTELRVICRLDAQKVHEDAAFKATIAAPAGA